MIVVHMLFAVFTQIYVFFSKTIFILHPVHHWLVVYLLTSDFCFLFVWNIVICKLVAVLQELASLYICAMIIVIFPVHWLIFYLLISVYWCFIWFIVAGVLLAIWKKYFFCILVKWSLSYIIFIDWFVTCLHLYGVSFLLKYCSWKFSWCFY